MNTPTKTEKTEAKQLDRYAIKRASRLLAKEFAAIIAELLTDEQAKEINERWHDVKEAEYQLFNTTRNTLNSLVKLA